MSLTSSGHILMHNTHQRTSRLLMPGIKIADTRTLQAAHKKRPHTVGAFS